MDITLIIWAIMLVAVGAAIFFIIKDHQSAKLAMLAKAAEQLIGQEVVTLEGEAKSWLGKLESIVQEGEIAVEKLVETELDPVLAASKRSITP
jgi:hypothetical protein